MYPVRLTGAGASGLKYDVITALSVAGLSGSSTLQVSMMRLIALITARYNWRLDEFCVGQRDMAKMWSVNERTVKREIKRLTQSDVIRCIRPGVRGRVGAYRLNYHQIAAMSEHVWREVGPDFDQRMRERYGQPSAKVVQLSTATPTVNDTSDPWMRSLRHIETKDQNVYQAWFSKVTFVAYENGILTLKAPGSFISRYIETHLLGTLIEAAEPEFGKIQQVKLLI